MLGSTQQFQRPQKTTGNTVKAQTLQLRSGTVNDDYITDLRDRLMCEGSDLENISLPILMKLQGHLNAYISDCVKDHDFSQAVTASTLNSDISNRIKAFSSETLKKKYTDQITDDPVILAFDQETDSRLSDLKTRQNCQFETFQNKWKNAILNMNFEPSESLRQLWYNETLLRVQGDDASADEMAYEAADLEEQERKDARSRVERKYQNARKKLMDGFKQEQCALLRQRKVLRKRAISRSSGVVWKHVEHEPTPRLAKSTKVAPLKPAVIRDVMKCSSFYVPPLAKTKKRPVLMCTPTNCHL